MRQDKCEICGQLATVHETAIESGGEIVVHHLCQEHGASALQSMVRSDDPRTQAALAELSEWYNGLTDVERNRMEMEYRLIRRGI
jgi:hypothetical protein